MFCAVALFYGLMPGGEHAFRSTTAKNTPSLKERDEVAVNSVPAPAVPTELPAGTREQAGPTELVRRGPTPAPVESVPEDIEKVQVADQSKETTTATPLHYQKPDVNVIWIDGLDYLPNVPDGAAPAPLAPTTPQPTINAGAQP